MVQPVQSRQCPICRMLVTHQGDKAWRDHLAECADQYARQDRIARLEAEVERVRPVVEASLDAARSEVLNNFQWGRDWWPGEVADWVKVTRAYRRATEEGEE